jgi:hypothetical protein
MPKGRRTNNRHKRKRLPVGAEFVSRGTQSGSLRSQSTIAPARRSWWDRTKEWWAEKFRDAEATVAPKRASRRVERMIHEQRSVGQMKQTRALGQVRRKT